MTYPTREKALEYLKFAKESMLEQGTPPHLADMYEQHCQAVAKGARLIAEKSKSADADKIEIMGLLHDMGKYKREKINKRNHAISGYEFMMKEGYPEIAHICLTHIFPYKHFSKASHDFMFGREEDISFVKEYLASHDYSIYDEIIQLVDMMTFSDSFVTIEERYNEIVERYGREDMRENQPLYNNLKENISAEIGEDVYKLLGVN